MQGFNMGRYVPPEHEGVVSGNKLAGKHALGSRARHLQSSGELTVRFEMPFAVWCLTCQPAESVIIGQGVRFNALKKKVGNYYSTPIYSFRMKHSVCGGWIEIRTDPQHTEYVVTEGARRKITAEMGRGEYEETTTGAGEIRIKMPGQKGEDEEVDPFTALEGKVADKNKYMTEKMRMDELLKQQDRDWEDPYENSRKLRRAFRVERKRREATQSDTEALRDKFSLGVDLLEENEGDRLRAGVVDFGPLTDAQGASSFGSMSNLRTKPLFKTADSSSDRPKSPTRTHHLKRRRKPGDPITEKKALLQQELRGNTRAAIDPFLLTDDIVWRQSLGTTRKKKINRATDEAADDARHEEFNFKNGISSGMEATSEYTTIDGVSGNTYDFTAKTSPSEPIASNSLGLTLVNYSSESD